MPDGVETHRYNFRSVPANADTLADWAGAGDRPFQYVCRARDGLLLSALVGRRAGVLHATVTARKELGNGRTAPARLPTQEEVDAVRLALRPAKVDYGEVVGKGLVVHLWEEPV